jgi:signal transduction histidine kinase
MGQFIERKRVEEQRGELLAREQAARLEAEAANRAKDEFLATLSHELRTPLNAILGWTRMLLDGTVDPARARHALETVDRNAQAQFQLISDMLDVSRIVAGGLRLTIREVDLKSVIAAAVEAVKPMAVEKNVTLRLSLDGSTCTTDGDPVRLQQVVWNLLSNAVKFTDSGGSVDIQLSNPTHDSVAIDVRDTGCGIAPEFLPFVFDRFRQGDPSLTREHGGLGLGLAIVRHLVDLHGGTVEAHSEGQGRGAVFTIRLRAASAGAPAAHNPRSSRVY